MAGYWRSASTTEDLFFSTRQLGGCSRGTYSIQWSAQNVIG